MGGYSMTLYLYYIIDKKFCQSKFSVTTTILWINTVYFFNAIILSNKIK